MCEGKWLKDKADGMMACYNKQNDLLGQSLWKDGVFLGKINRKDMSDH